MNMFRSKGSEKGTIAPTNLFTANRALFSLEVAVYTIYVQIHHCHFLPSVLLPVFVSIYFTYCRKYSIWMLLWCVWFLHWLTSWTTLIYGCKLEWKSGVFCGAIGLICRYSCLISISLAAMFLFVNKQISTIKNVCHM